LLFCVPFAGSLVCCWSGGPSGGGFIWIIFRDLVGGGGSAKFSPAAAAVVGGRRRDMVCSDVVNGDVGDMVRKDDDELFEALEDREPSSREIAGGGSLKESSSEERFRPSLAEMSVDEMGVGGRAGGGIATRQTA
jgi:hypothetical protein